MRSGRALRSSPHFDGSSPESGLEYGAKSKAALSALVAGKNVTVTIGGLDRYGRSLGWIEADGASVNRRMGADGWAWQYLSTSATPTSPA